METNGNGGKRDTHQEIMDYIVKAIEDGAPKLEMPWHGADGGLGGFPRNARSGANYNGVNVLTLWILAANK